jgi:hypothetical protein
MQVTEQLARDVEKKAPKWPRKSPKNSITRDQFTPYSVGNGQLDSNSVDGRTVLAGSMVNGHLAAYTVQNGRLADGSVNSRVVAFKGLVNDRFADGSVDSRVVGFKALVNDRLADNSVDGRVVLAGSLVNGHLAAYTIQNGRLADNTVDGRVLAALSVAGAHLADASVATAKLQDNAVAGVKLLGSTTDNTLRAVANRHIRDAVIDTRTLADGAVTGFKVAAETIGQAQLHANTRDQAQNVSSMRQIGTFWGGNSLLASANNHGHSVSFKELPRRYRQQLLKDRAALRESLLPQGQMERLPLRDIARRLRSVERLMVALLHMALDDPERTADAREVSVGREEYKDHHLERYQGDPAAYGRIHRELAFLENGEGEL